MLHILSYTFKLITVRKEYWFVYTCMRAWEREKMCVRACVR